MAALAHLAGPGGMGITLLPLACFRQMVLDGKPCVVESEMTLPTLEYFATFRNDYYVAFCEEITVLCDFYLSESSPQAAVEADAR